MQRRYPSLALSLLVLVLLFLLIACRTEPDEGVAPTAVSPIVPQATATNNTIHLPLATNNRATATPPAAPSPALSPTPLPPTATPTPAYPIYQGPPLARRDIGIQVHIHKEEMDVIFDHLQALDVGWVKVQVSWKLYQPAPQQYDDFRFGELDALVETAAARDIAVLLSVSKAPEWSRPTTEMDGPPLDNTLYQAFMEYLASRYRGRVAAYELWNEPNLQREWNGMPLNAADLVALIGAGAAGVRAADPAAILISAAPATTGINDGINAIDDRVYLRAMLAAGVADIVDAIGAHPYGWANPPDSSHVAPHPAVPSHNNHPSFFFQDTLRDYAALLDEFGITDKPLWVTEFGWGSFEGLDAPPPQGAEFMSAVSEYQQAVYVLRAYELAHEWEWVGPMILWNLNFGPLLGGEFSESGYSVLRPGGGPRPLYLALQTIPKTTTD